MAVKEWRRRKSGRDTVVHERHTETRAETVPQSILDRIAELERARSASDAMHMEQAKLFQEVLRDADKMFARLQEAEGRMDKNKGVINDIRSEVLRMHEAFAGVSDDAVKKRASGAA